MTDLQNPFSVTRAVDFDDEQIVSHWVELPGEGGAEALAKPNSQTPMIILGGKGSGKTHLMRFLSTVAQIKTGNRAEDVLKAGHIGIYMLCGGINPARFGGKGQNQEAWTALFHYYMDLILAERCLQATAMLVPPGTISDELEQSVASGIINCFDCWPFEASSNRMQIAKNLIDMRRNLDFDVNNCATTRKLATQINATPTSLVFGVPRVLADTIPSLRNTLFVYLLDELENLLDWQQMYVNSLVRENKRPCSVKVGAKLFGMKTYATYSANEELKEGSEYERLVLDERFRKMAPKSYNDFVIGLCTRRLSLAGVRLPKSQEGAIEWFREQFGEPEQSEHGNAETRCVFERPDKTRPWRSLLEKHIATAATQRFIKIGPNEVPEILAMLRCDSHPVVERFAVHVLYQNWRKPNLVEVASSIQKDMQSFIKGEGSAEFARNFRSWKGDMIANILRDYQAPLPYVGLDTLIQLSHGLPRNLLVLLKHVYGWSLFRNEAPFRGGQISIESQRLGVRDAAEWFFKDARMAGPDGGQIREGISRLAELLKAIRYSDKPAEVGLCAFSLPTDALNDRTGRLVSLSEQWSLISSVDGGRPKKNSFAVDAKFRLNPLLAPRWDLPISIRGDLELSKKDAEIIFEGSQETFEAFVKERTAGMQGPRFGGSKGDHNTLPLFGKNHA